MNDTLRRQQAYRRGRRGETLARLVLRLKGYRILAMDYKLPVGEIDLIVKRGNLLAFVEVKARSSYAGCLEAVTIHQRRRIERAAQAYLTANPGQQPENIRFDLVAVVPRRWPKHIMAAWQTDSP